MKIIIQSYGATINEFNPAEVDHIRVHRYFDVEAVAKREAPEVTYINHFDRPIPKTGRILAVYLHKSGTYHLYDPDITYVTFK